MVRFCCFGSEPDPVHLHGNPLSPPSRTLLAFCGLTGVPHEFHNVDLNTKAHLTDAYAKINPFQEVPALTHGSFNAWESGAMVTYIADVFNVNSPWYPKDIQIRARINSYIHWHHGNTRGPIVGYLGPKFFAPKFYGAPELSPHDEIPLKKKLTMSVKRNPTILYYIKFFIYTYLTHARYFFWYFDICHASAKL